MADIAAKVDGAQPGMKGICLRGLPGWGEMFAPLTTVVNTFGGTWFDEGLDAQVNSPGVHRGRPSSTSTSSASTARRARRRPGFTECLNAMSQGKVAMWYDATSAAGSLEDREVSKVAGKVGYAYAPVKKTESSGWLWAWAWAMPKTTKNADAAAKFMLWASSKEYEKLVGTKLGWSRVPVRQAGLDLREPGVPEGLGRVRRHHAEVDRGRRPDQPRRPAAADGRRAVRRHPGVPRPRHQGLAGDRPPRSPARRRSTRRWTRARSSPKRSPRSTRSNASRPAGGARSATAAAGHQDRQRSRHNRTPIQ